MYNFSRDSLQTWTICEGIFLSREKEDGTNAEKLLSKLSISSYIILKHFKVEQRSTEANQKYRVVLNLENVGPFFTTLIFERRDGKGSTEVRTRYGENRI